MTRASLAVVQRRALERALVDDVDARRYFALAGTLDAVRHSLPDDGNEPAGESTLANPKIDADGVLPAALLAVAVAPLLDGPPTSPAVDPWTPGSDATHPTVRRGARLALRWFDVPVERVATRARLPEADLTPAVEWPRHRGRDPRNGR